MAIVAAMSRRASVLPAFDFTTLALGASALPSGLSLTRASSGDSIQTGTSSVVVGLAANTARVGRRADSDLPALVIEETRTNLCVTPRALVGTGWAAGSGGTRTAASVLSPDGVSNSDTYSTPSGGIYSNYFTRTGADGAVQISLWMRATGAPFTSTTQLGLLNSNFSVAATWQRFGASYDTASGATYYVTPLNQGGVVAQAAAIDLFQIEAGAFATEWIPGGATRAGDRLQCAKRLDVNGRLALEIVCRPKGARAAYGSTTRLVYVDANNHVSFSGATGVVTCVVGGVAYSTPLGADWNAFQRVRFWIEIGANLPSLVAVQVDTGEPLLLSTDTTPASLGDWSFASCDLLHGAGTNQFSCWLESVLVFAVSGDWLS